MARGSLAKEQLTKKLLETFEGSFIVDKTLRVPMVENGETVEIKIALTCAKDVIGSAGTLATGSDQATVSASLTEEEKTEVKSLIEELNL